jgi:DNA-binding transcriptional regulator YiaG
MMNNKPPHDRVTPNANPSPRNCADCGEPSIQRVAIFYVAQVKHDGKLHEFCIPELLINQCDRCGEQFFTSRTNDQIAASLRAHIGLLQPEEIRHQLETLRLSQREFAEHLRVAPESVSRWLTGVNIQSRSLDALMRVYFRFPAVRAALKSPESLDLEPVETAESQDLIFTAEKTEGTLFSH